jgi:beta-lactamase regulating signal transducer with metallopeptidase domain
MAGGARYRSKNHADSAGSAIDDVVQPVAIAPSAPLPTSYAPAIMLFIWFCGFSIVVFSWARRWRGIRAVLRTAAPLDLDAPMKIMSSPARLEPGVFGVLRPVLVVPEGILDHLTPEQWRAILAHELRHVRRRDNLTAAIHMAVEAVFWFHPLVWWIGKRLVEERERACDEEALLASGDPQAYAEGILAVCRMYVESPLACVSGVTGSNLKKRIRAIMENRLLARLSLAKKTTLALAAAVAVSVPIAIGVLHAQSAQRPAFEVASVKPVDPNKTFFDHEINRERFVLTSNTVDFIVSAYNLRAACTMKAVAGENRPLILGAPEWARRERFEIRAKLPEGMPDYTGRQFGQGQAAQLDLMIQSLLEERFKLDVCQAVRQWDTRSLAGVQSEHHAETGRQPGHFRRPTDSRPNRP